MPSFNDHDESFENFVGKGENDCFQHFLLFPQYFHLYHRQTPLFKSQLIYHRSANTFNLKKSKIFPHVVKG